MTIVGAIKEVLRSAPGPMTAKAIYQEICRRGLYQFKTETPSHVVQAQIRRHSVGLDFPSAAPVKHFRLVDSDKFALLDAPIRTRKPQRRGRKKKNSAGKVTATQLKKALEELTLSHEAYVRTLKDRIIQDLHQLTPQDFERFSKGLLDAYGFEETQVTSVSQDGGIDGWGRLRVGLAHLNVAFQCKRWTSNRIQRPEIDRFRGAIQGDFEQGIFFATTAFSSGAVEASVKRGAVPIVLLDSDAIVDLMIQKNYGVQSEARLIPAYGLDLVLGDGDA